MTRNFFYALYFWALCAAGQSSHDVTTRWFIDKPTLKQDSINLIAAGITKIVVQDLYMDDSLGFRVLDTITWNLKTVNGQLSSVPSGGRIGLMPVLKQTFKKRKIVEVIGAACEKYKLTHHLDKKGRVVWTGNTCLDCACESRYYFDRAEYRYEKGLLKEILYFSKKFSEGKTRPYAKYVFTYLAD